jgi:integrase
LPDRSDSFRKTVATLIDDSGLSARVGADQLGHARPSMTQDVYTSRRQVHTEVAAAPDRAVGICDE